MKRPLLAAALVAFGLIAVLYFGTLKSVPFHPDETSLLFQSRDLEWYFQNPVQLAFDPSQPASQEMQYRALNAPLAKYILGLGRRLAGVNAASVATDWDWQESWQANIEDGAMPSSAALIGARAASTLMLLLALLAIAWAGFQLGGWQHALSTGILFGLNGLVLLHGRRAMAEGTLLFAIALLIAASFEARKRPWLAGVAAGLAISAKHSALPLIILPVSGLLLTRSVVDEKQPARRSWLTAILALLVSIVLLNPLVWKRPLSAVDFAVKSRRQFVQAQSEITETLANGAVLDTLTERAASLLGNAILLPPQFQEVGNYQVELSESIERYRENPLHQLLTGPIQGSLLLALVLLGFWGGFRSGRFNSNEARRKHAVLLTGTAAMAAATLLLNPLPYQRYYIPLVPLFVLWQGTGLLTLIQATRKALAAFTD